MGAPRGTFAGEVGGGGGAPEARAAGAGRELRPGLSGEGAGRESVMSSLRPES